MGHANEPPAEPDFFILDPPWILDHTPHPTFQTTFGATKQLS